MSLLNQILGKPGNIGPLGSPPPDGGVDGGGGGDDQGTPCTSDANCPLGKKCRNRKCESVAGIGCKSDAQCTPPAKCIKGNCVSPSPDIPDVPTCPDESKGAPTYSGCPCGATFSAADASRCPTGYAFVADASGGPKCACLKYCESIGRSGTDCSVGAGGEGGEFKWSAQLKALLDRLLGRANSLLDEPLGLTEQERQAIYNRAFEDIKGAERPTIQSAMDQASRMGMLGSPYASSRVAAIQRGTGDLLSKTTRDIAIDESKRRFQEKMSSYAMVAQLTQLGLSSEQIAEMLSSSRRGEGNSDMDALLAYFQMIMGGQNSAYWQAIMNSINGGGTA